MNEVTNTVYVTNLLGSSVLVIDGATNTVSATVPTGGAPAGVAVDEVTNTVYVASQSDESVLVIDGVTNTVSAMVPVGSSVFEVAVNEVTNTVYATHFDRGTVSVITPVTVPGVPTGVVATAGDGQASVAFVAPTHDGRSAITQYTVTATNLTTPGDGGQTATGSGTPLMVTGLTNGDSYTFTVSAKNGIGVGGASAASDAVTPSAPVPATVPGVPAGVAATAGDGQATVVFTVPSDDGGSTITGYSVIATNLTTPGDGGRTVSGSGSPIVVTGLINGASYTFTVTAFNSIGAGAASAASDSVIPSAAGTTPPAPTVKPAAKSATSSLAATGSDPALLSGFAGLLLIAGLAVLGAVRSRRA